MQQSTCPKHGIVPLNPTGYCKQCGERLIPMPNDPVQPPSTNPTKFAGWAVMIIISFVLIGIASWWLTQEARGSEPIRPSAELASSAVEPTETVTLSPSTTPKPPTQQPTRAPTSTIAASPVPEVNYQLTTLEPTLLYSGSLPITLTLRGSNLANVKQVHLQHPNGTRISLAVLAAHDSVVQVLVSELPPQSEAEIETDYIVQLDQQAQEDVTLLVRNAIEQRQVAGITEANRNISNRINTAGMFTRMRSQADENSERLAMLFNGDLVDILDTSNAEWYRVRVVQSQDAAGVGSIGWIERWLVDNTPPPTTVVTNTPQPPAVPLVSFASFVDGSYVGTPPTDQFSSCVSGRVYNKQGGVIAGARVNVNNGPHNNYTISTNVYGVFKQCDLGASYWDVILLQVPNYRLQNTVTGVIYVNGSSEQEAYVNFVMR